MALEGNYNGTSSRYVTFLAGIRAYCERHGIRVLYSLGSHLFKDRTSGLAQAEDRMAEAAMYAEIADVTIACVGLDAGLEGEEGDTGNEYFSGDKKDLQLPESQRKLLAMLQKQAKKLVTVIAAGSNLNVPEGDAKIFAWYPGQAGGTALARILFGEVNPGGKLPLTFYHSVEELPDFEDYAMANRTYRYFEGTPLYPFGYGLSYTKFEVLEARDGDHEVILRIRNRGNRDGETVAQVYVRCESDLAPTHPRLCGFRRVALAAGEEKEVRVKLDALTWTVVDENGERQSVEHGVLYAGLNQPDARSVALTGMKPIEIRK